MIVSLDFNNIMTLLHMVKKDTIYWRQLCKTFERLRLNNSFKQAKCLMKSFNDVKIQDLEHYVKPHVQE